MTSVLSKLPVEYRIEQSW